MAARATAIVSSSQALSAQVAPSCVTKRPRLESFHFHYNNELMSSVSVINAVTVKGHHGVNFENFIFSLLPLERN